MSSEKFLIEVEVGECFMGLLQDLSANEGFSSIGQWMASEINENIYEIINENLMEWGYDKYGVMIDDEDLFENQYDSKGDLVA